MTAELFYADGRNEQDMTKLTAFFFLAILRSRLKLSSYLTENTNSRRYKDKSANANRQVNDLYGETCALCGKQWTLLMVQ